MYLKELVEKLQKAYEKYGDIEVQTMNADKDYSIKDIQISDANDELFLNLKEVDSELYYKEGDTIKLKNGKIAKIISIGCAIGNFNNINLDDGTFCFPEMIEDIIERGD